MLAFAAGMVFSEADVRRSSTGRFLGGCCCCSRKLGSLC